MSGSMGYGKIDKVIRLLDELPDDFQALVVCGNNQPWRKRSEASKPAISLSSSAS